MKKTSFFSSVAILSVLSLMVGAKTFSASRTDSEAVVREATEAFNNYDFLTASEKLRKYASRLKKNTVPTEEYQRLKTVNDRALGFLSRVEKVLIVDSIQVSREDFYKGVRLNTSAGEFVSPEQTGEELFHSPNGPVYKSEGDEIILWCDLVPDPYFQAEESDTIPLVPKILISETMSDGSRGKEAPLPVAIDGNLCSPFLMADGQTLYFASDGKESIGGYDLFVSKRDPVTGEFLTPSNLGFPFNSPYDDLLIAFDEEAGVAWWVTDRHDPDGGTVTLYVFIPSEVRENYDPEVVDPIPMARVDSYRMSWGEEDYSAKAEEVRNITPADVEEAPDFFFPISRAAVYKSWDDFKSPDAARAMQDYLDELDNQAVLITKLDLLRSEFKGSPSPVRRSEILRLEAESEKNIKEIRRLKNNVIKLESNIR